MAIIDVAKLKNNIKEIKKLAGRAKVCAVVKANAYGHGSVGVSRLIEPFVDFFAVALTEEGIELRLSGIQKPILILIPFVDYDTERAVRYGLSLTVEDVEQIKAVDCIAKEIIETAFVHIKVDTGMHRFGVQPNRLNDLLKASKDCKNVTVEGVYSHFYCAENPLAVEDQFKKFSNCVNRVKDVYPKAIAHISASGGVLAGSKYNLDMVRAGLLIYGYKPFESERVTVEPIMQIKAKKLKTNRILKGGHVLYGEHTLSKDTDATLVRVGYADGFLRHSDGIINNRCMDVTALEADDDCEWVTVFDGAEQPAKYADTITYEILCGLTARSQVIYKE